TAADSYWSVSERCCRTRSAVTWPSSALSRRRGATAQPSCLKIIADEKDGRIPAAARFSLDVLARQHAAIAAETGAMEKRIHAWHRSSEEEADQSPRTLSQLGTRSASDILRSGRTIAAARFCPLSRIRNCSR